MKRRIPRLIGVVFLCTLLLVFGCQLFQESEPKIVYEEPAEAHSGPKHGEKRGARDLPSKGDSAELPPINPEGGPKKPTNEIEVIEPGLSYRSGNMKAKKPPEDDARISGEGPKEGPSEVTRTRHAIVLFNYSRDKGIVPEVGIVIPGELIPSTTIDGDMLYVVKVNEKPIYVGSFRDPLYMVSLPQTPDQGYKRIELDHGTFTIAIPESFLDTDLLATATVEFYRKGSIIPFDTPLTVRTSGEILEASKLLYTVIGPQIVEVLQKNQ